MSSWEERIKRVALLLIFVIAFLLVLNKCDVTYAAEPVKLVLPIVEIHDGDTIRTTLPLPGNLSTVYVRILGIDTPEMPAESYKTTKKLGLSKCSAEAEQALAARDVLVRLGAKEMTIVNPMWDKYGGRIDAEVYINGINVAELLIAQGFAVEYDGGAKTTNWCK